MVKSEDITDNWREVFESNRWVPPHSQTVRLAVDNHFTQSSGFQLCLHRVTAPHLPQVTSPSLGVKIRYWIKFDAIVSNVGRIELSSAQQDVIWA